VTGQELEKEKGPEKILFSSTTSLENFKKVCLYNLKGFFVLQLMLNCFMLQP
jgi:hypothetical protein